ncbi:hypothetical protein TRIUR3_05026 [Triticum urartu]|uniref:Uncharacterized protein n=1 Tax=Triticum urartu TaxID=4572 RepID=M7YPP8_TRIUA|nr:hypothetical protein TRIUR3_05026 [Triticum urartu]
MHVVTSTPKFTSNQCMQQLFPEEVPLGAVVASTIAGPIKREKKGEDDRTKFPSLAGSEDENDDRLHFPAGEKEIDISKNLGDIPAGEKEIDISKNLGDIIHLEITLDAFCSSTCKGMCLVCGASLNTSSCSCGAEESSQAKDARRPGTLKDLLKPMQRR